MRVLAICGSLQQKSGNLELLRIAARDVAARTLIAPMVLPPPAQELLKVYTTASIKA